jgi:hypothetical protein
MQSHSGNEEGSVVIVTVSPVMMESLLWQAIALLVSMDDTACKAKEHFAGHVVCASCPKNIPFLPGISCGRVMNGYSCDTLNEDFFCPFFLVF